MCCAVCFCVSMCVCAHTHIFVCVCSARAASTHIICAFAKAATVHADGSLGVPSTSIM